jgi:lysine 2,3-aminomutase
MVESQSWKNNFREAFKDSVSLFRFLDWESSSLLEVEKQFPLFIPLQLAKKIKLQGPNGVLAREFLPDLKELNSDGLIDPIGDKEYSVAPQLIHRYSSRVLFTPTSVCPVHCRYCFRRNELSPQDELFSADFEKTLEYLKSHPEISEVIFTGGDPLTLSNEKLRTYLTAFSEIESIRDIRFHSRYPVILPERMDDGLYSLFNDFSKKFRTMSLAIHANHVDEFDELSVKKILEFSKLDIQLLSQTVLLKGVNDKLEDLYQLINLFLELKIRPYYLHHPDQVKGGLHFYLTLEEGRSLYGQLRSKLPGWAIPQYIIDIPGGFGKVGAYNPETTTFSGQLLGQNGQSVTIIEPDQFSL